MNKAQVARARAESNDQGAKSKEQGANREKQRARSKEKLTKRLGKNQKEPEIMQILK